MKCNPFYMLRIKNGIYSTDNAISYYRNKLPDDTFSFDSSNQKVQANLDEFGTIKNLTFFHHNYYMERNQVSGQEKTLFKNMIFLSLLPGTVIKLN